MALINNTVAGEAPMTKRSPQTLLKVFETHKVVEFKTLQAALDNASRATTFRYLRQIRYHRSYNHNGRYYTRYDPRRYDRLGLFCQDGIFFSRENTLGETIQSLVWGSDAGWTQRELQEVLRVRVQVVLLNTVRQGKTTREKVNGLYVYLHTDADVRSAQLARRREKGVLSQRGKDNSALAIEDEVVIWILLTLLRHPGATEAHTVRYLRGHSPPVTMAEVRIIFTRYELANLSKKGGATNY